MSKILGSLRQDIKLFRQLEPFYGTLKPHIALSILLGLISTIVESFAVSVIVFFVLKTITQEPMITGNNLFDQSFAHLVTLLDSETLAIWLIIIGLVVIRSVCSGAYYLVASVIANTIHHRVRSALFRTYMSMPYKRLSKLDYGTMANSLHIESWYVAESVKTMSDLIIGFCAVFAYLGVMFFFSWPLATIALLFGFLFRILFSRLKAPLRRFGFLVTEKNEVLTARMYTRMQAIKSFRAHGLEAGEITKFDQVSSSLSELFTHLSARETHLKPLNDFLTLMMIACLVWLSSYLGNSVTITVTVVAILYRLQPHFFGIEGCFASLALSQGHLEALLRQLELGEKDSSVSFDNPYANHWQKLCFENVFFSYDGTPVLKGVSFTLSKGEILAVRGLSGAGKTSLINLLLRLTEPDQGVISVDGKDLKSIDRTEWLMNAAAAGQDFELHDGTLHENLTLERAISDEHLWEALSIAEIADFVDSLPEKLNTRIGERGARLSGGQRQRIILARALAGKPSFLILDEATSAVSIDVEHKIYQNILEKCPNTTIVIITHRSLPEHLANNIVEI